ncbi:MAG: hypothetical protein E7E21_03930 [Peptostreptococcaceae bacterium]|nr:hypothetical protein [Peptostreptococcaceae bacterium]
MKTLNIRYKDGFKIEEDTKLYPIKSDISDKIGVLVEHRRLNGSNRYLRYGIQKLSGKYYFFDVRNSVISKTRESEYNTYICPYCRERMFIVSAFERQGTMIPIHLKHYKKTNKECIFRSDAKSMKLRDAYYKSEEFLHKEIQDYVHKRAKEGFKLSIPNSYKLYKNTKTNAIRAEIQKEQVNIVNAVIVYNESDKLNKRYTPDIILYTDDNRQIDCEISVYKSLNSADYYEQWQNRGKTVIEIKKTEIMDMHLDGYKFSRDLVISYLYDSILDKARKRKISQSQKIIDDLRNNKTIIDNLYNNKTRICKTKNSHKENYLKKLEQHIKEKKLFKAKVNSDIEEYLNNLCKENILRKEYIDNRTESQKIKDKIKGHEPQNILIYFEVKENKEAKLINVSIEKGNNVAYKRIPAIIEDNLRNDGYKVGMASVKNVINDK